MCVHVCVCIRVCVCGCTRDCHHSWKYATLSSVFFRGFRSLSIVFPSQIFAFCTVEALWNGFYRFCFFSFGFVCALVVCWLLRVFLVQGVIAATLSRFSLDFLVHHLRTVHVVSSESIISEAHWTLCCMQDSYTSGTKKYTFMGPLQLLSWLE